MQNTDLPSAKYSWVSKFFQSPQHWAVIGSGPIICGMVEVRTKSKSASITIAKNLSNQDQRVTEVGPLKHSKWPVSSGGHLSSTPLPMVQGEDKTRRTKLSQGGEK